MPKTREVYCGSYQTGVDGFMERCSDIRVMKPDDLAAALNEPVILAGDGVDAYLDTWQTMTPAVGSLHPSGIGFPGPT